MKCIFCDIVNGKLPCYKVWEDEDHLAFLSIYPNTKGFTVVITKEHFSSYAFEQSDEILTNLTLATKKVANILVNAFDDVARCGMFYEGYGVDHLHSKLFPMHGTGDVSKFKKISSNVDKYFTKYEGYISSHDYKKADEHELIKIYEHIKNKNL